MKFINWFKTMFRIVRSYDQDIKILARRAAQAEQIIRERTDIHADIHFRGENHVIVIGKYRGVDYIQTFSVSGSDFSALVDQIKEMERYGCVKKVDAPPQMRVSFKELL